MQNKWKDVWEPLTNGNDEFIYDTMEACVEKNLFEEIANILNNWVYLQIWPEIRNPMLWEVSKNRGLEDGML